MMPYYKIIYSNYLGYGAVLVKNMIDDSKYVDCWAYIVCLFFFYNVVCEHDIL